MLSSLRSISTALNKRVQPTRGFLTELSLFPINVANNATVVLYGWVALPPTSMLYGLGLYTDQGQNSPFTSYTIPISGSYIISALINFQPDANAQGTVTVEVTFTNPSSSPIKSELYVSVIDSHEFSIVPSRTLKLTQGTVVSVQVTQTTGPTLQVLKSYWGVVLKNQTGTGQSGGAVMTPSVAPVTKILTNYAKERLGFNATVTGRTFPNEIVVNSGFVNVDNWLVTGPGGWTSSAFNPTTGSFKLPFTGFFHLSATTSIKSSDFVIGKMRLLQKTSSRCGSGPITVTERDNLEVVNTLQITEGVRSVQIPAIVPFFESGITPGIFIERELFLQVELSGGAGVQGPTGPTGSIDVQWSMSLHQKYGR